MQHQTETRVKKKLGRPPKPCTVGDNFTLRIPDAMRAEIKAYLAERRAEGHEGHVSEAQAVRELIEVGLQYV